jgi:hypothetical protein
MGDNHVFAADSFINAIGVNVHTWAAVYDATNAYSQDWIPLVSQLGIRHVRDAFFPNDIRRATQHAAAVSMASQGINVLYIIDTPGLSNEQNLLNQFLGTDMPLPDGVEPWNEYDIKSGFKSCSPPQWMQDIQAFQPGFYQAVKAKWHDVPVLTSAVSNVVTTPPVGSLLPYADAANMHLYGVPALTPEFSSIFAPSKMPAYTNQAPGKPIWITETGLITGPVTPINLQTSELAAARLIPRMLLYCWAPALLPSVKSTPAPNTRGGLGAERVFIYELLDEHDSTSSTLGEGDRYGLFKSDLSPKLAATALGNLIRLLGDPGQSFTLMPLLVTATGPYADKFESITFQKRDGSYWLAFWAGYDATADPIGVQGQGSGADLPDTPYNVSLQFDHTFQHSELYRPLYGMQPIQQSGALGSITVPARLDVQLLRLSGTVKPGSRARGMRSYYDSRPNSLG